MRLVVYLRSCLTNKIRITASLLVCICWSTYVLAQSSIPFVDGSRIQLPAVGYFLVRDANNIEMCQGTGDGLSANNYGTSDTCENLVAGTYTVENLSGEGPQGTLTLTVSTGGPDPSPEPTGPDGNAGQACISESQGSNTAIADAVLPRPVNVRWAGADTLEWDVPSNLVYPVRQYVIIENNNDSAGANSTVDYVNVQDISCDGQTYRYVPSNLTAGTNYTVVGNHDNPSRPGDNGRLSPKGEFATVHSTGSSITPNVPFVDRVNTVTNARSYLNGKWQIDFDEEFNGSGQLSDRPQNGAGSGGRQWFFGGSDLLLAPSRQAADRNHAVLDGNGLLVMTAQVNGAAGYSYLATADDDRGNDDLGNANGPHDYYLDLSSDVYIETSVKLDDASPAYNAWWAFWLMAPGNSGCEVAAGEAFNAYDGRIDTGSEIDIFELVPDNANGFNTAIFRAQDGFVRCLDDGSGVARPTDIDFTYAQPTDLDVVIPNYMDGEFHTLGLYYSASGGDGTSARMTFFIDDIEIWSVTDPDFITKTSGRQSIRLTWEVDDSNVWQVQRDTEGRFAERTEFQRELLAADRSPADPMVSVAYVKVWKKASTAAAIVMRPILEVVLDE